MMDKDEMELKSLMQENYRELFGKLKRAVAGKFYYEAIFIEYAIMEDRTESILRHGDHWEAYLKWRGKNRPSIESKINKIKNYASDRKDLSHRYFSDSLLDDIRLWKEQRNALIHVLLKQGLDQEELAQIALTGKKLADQLRNRTGNYTRALERRSGAVK